MRIERLALTNYRNIETLELTPCEGVNIIYGDNAQGKTNLIEAIWLLTGAKSFRSGRDSDLIKNGAELCRVEANYYAFGRSQQLRLTLAPKKLAEHNGIALPSVGKMSGELHAVAFSPTHLRMMKEGPDERRDFLDTTICQLKPQYIRVLADHSRVLQQRNALLKEISAKSRAQHAAHGAALDVWDTHLARLSAIIMRTRHTYLEKLREVAQPVYYELAGGRERLGISYQPRVQADPELTAEQLQAEVLAELLTARAEDIRGGVTTVGAHRDDVLFTVDESALRTHGSQGQQRSAVLALKLAECEVMRQTSGEQPIVLLDDVMSELDAGRRSFLLNNLSGRQIFITCCEPELFAGLREGRSFLMQGGRVADTHSKSAQSESDST